MPADRWTLSVPANLKDELDDLAELTGVNSPALAASTVLNLHSLLMARELQRIPLTVGEASALAEVMNSATVTAGIGPILYGEVADAFHIARAGRLGALSSFSAHHGIDEDALLAKLQGIGPSADLALRLALARWWRDHSDDDLATGFRAAGLRIDPTEPPHKP